MKKMIKTAIAAAIALAGIHANAATLSVDVPFTIDIVPNCMWTNSVNDPNLLTGTSMSEPVTAQLNISAACNTGIAYTIKADTDSKTVSKGGEAVTIGIFSDASHAAPLASGVGITGVAGALVVQGIANVHEIVYFKVDGERPGGGFLSGGTIPLTAFTLTITY